MRETPGSYYSLQLPKKNYKHTSTYIALSEEAYFFGALKQLVGKVSGLCTFAKGSRVPQWLVTEALKLLTGFWFGALYPKPRTLNPNPKP